jgi:hypothetical protein
MGSSQSTPSTIIFPTYNASVPIRYIPSGCCSQKMDTDQPVPPMLAERGVTQERFSQTLMTINRIDKPFKRPFHLIFLAILVIIAVTTIIAAIYTTAPGTVPIAAIIGGCVSEFLIISGLCVFTHLWSTKYAKDTQNMLALENQYYFSLGIQMVESYHSELSRTTEDSTRSYRQIKDGYDFIISPGVQIYTPPVYTPYGFIQPGTPPGYPQLKIPSPPTPTPPPPIHYDHPEQGYPQVQQHPTTYPVIPQTPVSYELQPVVSPGRTPVTSPRTTVSIPLTPITSPRTPVNTPLTPVTTPRTPVNTPLTPVINPVTLSNDGYRKDKIKKKTRGHSHDKKKRTTQHQHQHLQLPLPRMLE